MAVVTVGLVRYPGIVSGARTWVAIAIFVVLLVVYVACAVNLGARQQDDFLALIAVVGGVGIAASWLALGLDSSLGGSATLDMVLLALGPLISLVVGWVATRRSTAPGAGIGCVGLTSLIAGFALFLLWTGATVATGGRPYDAGMLRDFKTSGASDLATYAVNDSLGTGMMLLLLVPVLSMSAGLVGSAAGARRTHSLS